MENRLKVALAQIAPVWLDKPSYSWPEFLEEIAFKSY